MNIKKIEINIYNTWIERFPRESDLYLTEEELRDAEERGEGKLSSKYWEIIEEARSKRQ